ncbi:MAG: class I SAM-dependent methyltransferase [Thermoleophilia bacterium]|nr:class I SAM-dependent methyltransferase [Thermoleophilia bacterium]
MSSGRDMSGSAGLGAREVAGRVGRGAECGPRADTYPEPGKIRQMFDDIAGRYDRLNDLMTAGLHHRWREMGVMLAGVGPGDSALDVCCGTGDLAFALRRAVGATGRVVGVDVSEEMLKVAREKCGRNQLHVEFRTGDALDLPFPSGDAAAIAPGGAEVAARLAVGFDACTVGFGIRNVADITKAFSEMRRVCRPDAKVVCLEITQPRIPVFKQFYGVWFDCAVPWLGKFAAGDESAYRYLPESVKRLPDPEELKGMMKDAGLRNPRYEILAGGIIALHHAVV